VPRARDVVLCGTAAEETRGEGVGVDWLLEAHPEALGPPGAVWNEGGAAVRVPPLGDRVVSAVAVSEKRGQWLTLVAEGEGGHGAQPVRDSANRRLVRALARLDRLETPRRVPPPVAETLRRVAPSLEFPWSLAARLATRPFALRLAGPWLDDIPMVDGFVRDTIALTGLRSGVKHNVIPRRAEATLDVRLLPDSDPAAVRAALEEVIDDPAVRLVPPADEADAAPVADSPWDHELFRAIEAGMAAEAPGGLTLPVMMPAGTDSRFFRERGIPAYGFLPAQLDLSLTRAIHGRDERIPLDGLEMAVRVTYRTLLRLVRPGEG
jgi:acetylornithine deacetylase/succinyl-diaminopimelate desuccinylase-like protein